MLNKKEQDFIWNLYSNNRQRMYHLAIHIMGDRVSAEDMIQSTILKLMDKANMLMSRAEPQQIAYLMTTLKYTAFREKKESRSRPVLVNEEYLSQLPDTKNNPETLAVQESEYNELLQHVYSLEETDQDILVLFYYGGFSYHEIAEIVHISAGNVGVRKHRSIEQLKMLYQGKGDS